MKRGHSAIIGVVVVSLIMMSVPLVAADFTADLTSTQTFNRPAPGDVICGDANYGTFTTVSSGSATYSYATQAFTPSISGDYVIEVTGSTGDVSDPMLLIYEGSFNPGNPTANFKVGDDDTGADNYPKVACENTFTGGTTYVIVSTTYSSGATDGTITFSISGTGSVVVLPTVSTDSPSSIGSTSVILGGDVSDNGGATVNSRGVAWGTSSNPTSGTPMGSGTGSFSQIISGLNSGTAYYARAYATNSVGTAYGLQVEFTTEGPTLTLDNVTAIASDWGRDFNMNHSVTVTSAIANNVNVTYNVSWIADNSTMGTITKDGMKWHNQSIANSTVQEITVRVNATSTTGSATNDSKTFLVNITRRDIDITSQPESTESVGTDTTFWINASANDEHEDMLICKADLIREGVIIEDQTLSGGNANFSRIESLAGTFNFSIRFYNMTHYDNASTSNSTVTVLGPILALANVDNVASDWGRDFNMNHSVTVTSAIANNVNVTYNVSWILANNTMATIAEGGIKWHNQTRSNSTVQEITVKADATSTTGSATNDIETFQVNITRRDIDITSQPESTQSVGTDTTFWINASANDEHEDMLICKADLIREGVIIGNQTQSDGNANFIWTEPLAGTFNFSIQFYNLTYYFNASTDNSTVSVENPPPPSGGSSSSGSVGVGVGTSDEPENVEETVILRIYLGAGGSSTYNFNNVITSVEVTPDRTYGLVAARIEVLASQPGSITNDLPAGVIYKYVNIFVGTSGWAEGKLSDSMINFQVPTSWFEENNIDPASVVMYRHHNGEWELLESTTKGQAGGFYQYSSPTLGFSTFLILGQVEGSSSGEPVAKADSGTVADSTPASEATTTKGTPGFGILLGILAVISVLVYRKRN